MANPIFSVKGCNLRASDAQRTDRPSLSRQRPTIRMLLTEAAWMLHVPARFPHTGVKMIPFFFFCLR